MGFCCILYCNTLYCVCWPIGHTPSDRSRSHVPQLSFTTCLAQAFAWACLDGNASRPQTWYCASECSPKEVSMNTNNMPFELCLGHTKSVRHPSIKPYLLPNRYPVDVFSPSAVYASVQHARQCIVQNSGHIWWVGERKCKKILQDFHKRTGEFVVGTRWPAGMLTNFTVHSATHDLQYPSLLVVLSVNRNINAIKEAKKVGVPIVGIVDTNADIKSVDVAVLANDDGFLTTRWLIEALQP